VVPAASSTDVVRAAAQSVLEIDQQKPASSRGGDRDDGAALAALVVQALPGAMQALLSRPGDRQHVGGLGGASAWPLRGARR
jgi:hypothetical protein